MKGRSTTRRVRIPVELVDGVWECAFGGIPPVKNRSRAELIVDRDSISDRPFLESMECKARYKVLEEGTSLLVCLTIKRNHLPPSGLEPLLRPYTDLRAEVATELFEMIFEPSTLFFVEVKLGGPDNGHVRRFSSEQGGLWLLTHGREAIGLASTTVLLPSEIRKGPASSLNHAYTVLSETFETWRMSHTGNIYRHVLYRETNGRWYPLDLLRDETLARQEHEIANGLWRAFMAKMAYPVKA